MSEYKPDEKVLEQIVENVPDEIKTQIQLSSIAVKNISDYTATIIHKNGMTSMDLVGPPNETMAGGAMLNAAVAAVGAANKSLNISIDELLIFIRETLKLSNITTHKKI